MPIAQEKTYWVYIASSKPHGMFYVGMTSDLADRTGEHRERVMDGFTNRYWVGSLVYFEAHDDAEVAAKRERAIKRWRGDLKIRHARGRQPNS